MSHTKELAACTTLILILVVAAGCKKKVSSVAPPPAPAAKVEEPPPSEPPVISEFVAEPGAIERGHTSTLRWSVSNAPVVSLEPETGAVGSSGRREVSPTENTTYTLRASGPGGKVSATATVTVTIPPPPPAEPPRPAAKSFAERLASEVRDAYFDFDRFHIREDARAILTANAQALKALLEEFPDASVVIEGHCDERGSAEYNLGLGDRRSRAANEFLILLGVPADKLKTISYGKERPQCTEQNEECWQKNRRVHSVPGHSPGETRAASPDIGTGSTDPANPTR